MRRRVFLLAVTGAIVFAAVWFYHGWQHWLSHGTGSYNCPSSGCPGGSPHNYNFNSGFGSILLPPVITLAGLGIGLWWKNQCGIKGCYWPARRTTDAGDRACWRHHPHPHLTVELLHRRHHAAKAESPGRAPV